MNLKEEWPMPNDKSIHGGPSRAVLNPTLNLTYSFVSTVLDDFKLLFPNSEFIHLGGDEVLTEKCWVKNPEIKQWMKDRGITTGDELFHFFVQKVEEIAKKANVKTAHWVYDDNFDLKWDEGSILQYWGDKEHIIDFQKTYPDNQHILSVHDYFYLD
jgi:hexosaminidase